MSPQPWLQSIRQALLRLRKDNNPLRVAVVGIGQELNGDDSAGVLTARALQRRLTGNTSVLVIDAGPAPENFTGKLRTFAPHLVLLVDAAALGEAPGAVRWLDWKETSGLASSHTLPPYVLGEYLTASIGCEVALLGIQPGQTEMGTVATTVVNRTASNVAKHLALELCAEDPT